MKRAAFFLLAAVVPAFSQYSYYDTDNLNTLNSTNWTENGSAGSFTSSGFTSTGASTLVANSTNNHPPPPASQTSYEVKMTLNLTQSGGTFSSLLRASSNASLTTSTLTGTFYAIEIANVTFTSGVCSATLASYKVINGSATPLSSGGVPCNNGMTVRSVITTSGVIVVYLNNELWLVASDSSITSGSPGVSVYSSPSANTISQVQLGPLDTVAPNAIAANTVATSPYPNHVDLQWQGVSDNAGGIGLFDYTILRSDPAHPSAIYIGTSVTPDFVDASVSPGITYSYYLQATDFHQNSAWTTIEVITPPTGNIDPRETGVRSLGSYWGDGAEQIDMRSGNLNYSIPLIKAMARGWSASFNLTYNSQNWRLDNAGTWKLGDDVGYGFGWQLLAGSLTPLYYGDFTINQYLFTDSTGAQYHLNQNSGGVWSSTESIYVWYDSNVGRLYFRDGSFWVFGCTSAGTEQDAGTMYPTLMEDTNGNQITITYQQGSNAAFTNSSARIVTIQDTRANGGTSYQFSYTTFNNSSHLSSITNSLGTAEAYTFNYTAMSLITPLDNLNYGTTSVLSSMQQTPTLMSTGFNYDSTVGGTSGQMTAMNTQYGGSLQWAYSNTNPPYANGAYFMEVSSRQLVKQAGATATTYPITYGAASIVHSYGMVQDPGGLGQKVWTFDNTSSDAQVGLATQYNARVNFNTDDGGQRVNYNWTTNSSNNLYTWSTFTTQDVNLSSQIAKYTTQTQDQYGNVTSVGISNYYTTWSQQQIIRTYNNTYLNSSGYTSAHIVNRLTGSSVTDGTNTSTLSTISYDSDNTAFQADPGITQHDSAYACTYGTTGCTTYNRGNPTTIRQPGNYTTLEHDIAGNVVFSIVNGVWTTPTTNSSTNYTVPSAITTGSLTTNLGFSSFLGLTNETGPNGDSLGIGYNASARPANSTSPYGAYTTYAYNDTATPPNHSTNTNNHGTVTIYDGFGRTITAQTGTWSGSTFTVVSQVDTVYGSCGCSPLGKMTQVSMPHTPSGSVVYTTYAYDGMGRTLTKTAPDGSVTTYAYSGNTVTVTDPAGKWKIYTMDSLGNLAQVLEPDPSLGNVTTSYTYDILNHLITVSMPRGSTTQTRTFNYTSSNIVGALLLSATNPENGTVTYTYNGNNQIATKTDAKNQQIQYTYDSYNRVTQVSHFLYQMGGYVEDVTQRVTYSYDTNPYDGGNYSQYTQGRLAAIKYQPAANTAVSSTLPTFSEWYSYTQPGSVAGKQLQISQYLGPTSTAVLNLDGSWTYNSEGKMVTETYPSVSNHSGTYTTGYDAMYRPSTLIDNSSNTWASNVSYGPSNELLTLNSESRTYNSLLQLTQITVTSGSSTIFSQQYIYPTNGMNNGKAIQQNDLVSGEQVVYAYDSLNRLLSAQTTSSSTPWGQAYVYDGFGNLYQKNVTQGSAPSLSVTVNTATNQLVETGLGYDANGNAVGVYPASQTYDVENRVSSAGQYNNPQVLYAYDPHNRRVWKGTVNSSGVITAQEMYFYGATGKKLGTYVATFGPVNTSYWTASDLQIHLGKRRVAHWAEGNSGTQVTLVATILDRVGSVRTGVSNGGTSSFYPYGEDKGTAAQNDQTKFATYTRDSATGLDYAMNRYYSSVWGRFVSPDPNKASAGSKDPQSWNRYAYTRNDPVNRVDPRGLDDCPVDFCVTGTDYGGGDYGQGQDGTVWSDGDDPATNGDIIPIASQAAQAMATLERDYEEIDRAIFWAFVALSNPKCAALFGTPGTAGQDNVMIPSGAQLLDQLAVSGDFLPGPLASPQGYTTIATATGQGMVMVPLYGSMSQMLINTSVVITLNTLPGGFFSEGLTDQVDTILHELGHAFWDLFGPGTSQVMPDGPQVPGQAGVDQSIANSALVKQDCNLPD